LRRILGISPTRYLLLQRLNKASAALQRANPSTTSVAKIARDLQFLELGRFAVTYHITFGEWPCHAAPVTLNLSGIARIAESA
jgi:transcriptional regulator GlxA family with amidase domain